MYRVCESYVQNNNATCPKGTFKCGVFNAALCLNTYRVCESYGIAEHNNATCPKGTFKCGVFNGAPYVDVVGGRFLCFSGFLKELMKPQPRAAVFFFFARLDWRVFCAKNENGPFFVESPSNLEAS